MWALVVPLVQSPSGFKTPGGAMRHQKRENTS